jgi:hypothetical protein
MIVAVIAMMTMQASLVNVVQVIAVRDPRMVPVLGGLAIVQMTLVLGAPVVRRAAVGVPLADLETMGLNAVSLLMLQAIISQVVHVVTVTKRRMPGAVPVSMCHCPFLSDFRVSSGSWFWGCRSRRLDGLEPASCIPWWPHRGGIRLAPHGPVTECIDWWWEKFRTSDGIFR